MTRNHPFSVVLVHGGFVDGSGWESVYGLLRRDGFTVRVVQNSTLSLEADVAATKQVVAMEERPVLLVGHSYGGAVITEAGNDPMVRGLVYVAAFAPDAGESVQTLIQNPPAGAPVPPIVPMGDDYLLLDRAKFHAAFAADLAADKAAFMADAQVPWGIAALEGTIRTPAWRSRPSWYLVSTEDRMIPPAVQRFMAKRAGAKVSEADGSHAIYMSRPELVAELIVDAADSKALAA